MKYFLSILILIFFWAGTGDGGDKTLKPFSVRLWAGDEGSTLYKIRVYLKNGEFYADKTSPDYYYGNNYDSVWTVKLDSAKILACLKFVEKAKKLSKKCKETFSSYREEFLIVIDTTKIHVGTCYWDCCDYYSLVDTLFSEQFKKLKQQRSELLTNINISLGGKWFLTCSSLKTKFNDTIKLTRQTGKDTTCYWEFGDNYSFKSHCNELLDLHKSEKYEILVGENKHIDLTIEGGSNIEKDGSSSVANYGAWFIVDSVSNNRIILRYKWRR